MASADHTTLVHPRARVFQRSCGAALVLRGVPCEYVFYPAGAKNSLPGWCHSAPLTPILRSRLMLYKDTRMPTGQRNEAFGRLLTGAVNSIASYEGKTAAAVEEDLGGQLGVSGKTIQRYKAGHLPPDVQAVTLLGTAGVQRGLLGREWLQRFLNAARHPLVDQLVAELVPQRPTRERPPRVYENLPAPTYAQFVQREQAIAAIADGLQQRTAVVLVVGLGGNGKTSLVREVAALALRGDLASFRTDAVVWVSDKDRPGTTNLSIVLDEIARTLDYPGLLQLPFEERRREVEQLLRRQSVLLVVDNLETVTDSSLLTWLLRLPEPSKALVTSRERHRALWGSWLVELRGMHVDEALNLIDQRLRMLNLAPTSLPKPLVPPFIAVTGGNPKAIELTLGLAKHERRPLPQLIEDLQAGRGGLFDDLFARAWSLLDEPARRTLCAAGLFAQGLDADALGAAADVRGHSLQHALEHLTELALLDAEQADLQATPHYAVHPLVRSFTGTKVGAYVDFADQARQRWAIHLLELINVIRIEQPGRVPGILDAHAHHIRAYLDWAYTTKRWDTFLACYWRTEMVWDISTFAEERIPQAERALQVALDVGDTKVALRASLRLTRLYSFYRRVDEAQVMFHQAEQLYEQADADFQEQVRGRWESTEAIVLITSGQPARALERLDATLSHALHPQRRFRKQYWRALALYKLERLDEAKAVLHELLIHSDPQPALVTKCRVYGLAADIALEEGRPEDAHAYLQTAMEAAIILQDRYQIARLERTWAHLHQLRGEGTDARDRLVSAIDIFTRLGMPYDVARTREAFAGLEALQ